MLVARKVSAYIAFSRRCLELLVEDRGIFAAFVGLSVLAALTEGLSISLLVPILEAQAGPGGFSKVPLLGGVSELFSGFSAGGRIQAAAFAIAAAVILRNLLQYAVDMLSATLPLRLEQKLNQRSYSALMNVEIGYIHRNEIGEMLNGIGGWSHRVTVVLTSTALIVSNLMTVAVYVVLMLAVSWQMAVMAVAFMLLMSLLLRWLTLRPLKRAGELQSLATTRVNQIVTESITGMKLIRLSAGEAHMTSAYSRALDDVISTQRSAAKLSAIGAPALSSFAALFICALLVGSARLQSGDPSTWISSVMLFLFLLFRLMGPVSSMNIARNRIINHMPAFDALDAFYRITEGRRQPTGVRQAQPLRDELRFDNVTFTYNEGETPALQGLSLSIRRGTMAAIAGPSGAGKSTLIALAARLYDPQQGRILADGIDLREFDIRSWRKRIAVVSQDIFLFNDTVANNVAFGQDGVSRERIREACRLASAENFIEELPQGYETMLGDRGVRLSGGQQQRIAIARAILANPDILIFDEATSQLDTFTERAIQAAMEQLAKSRTLLVIAHRLSTIRKADKVFVLERGRVIEEGNHVALMARTGAYANMVRNQSFDLIDDGVELAEVRA